MIATIGILAAPFYIMIITGVDQLKRTQFNYSFVVGISLMLLVVFLAQKEKRKIIKNIAIIVILVIAYKQSYHTANLFYTADMVYRSDEAFAYQLMNEVEKKEWYDPNQTYKIIFVGRHQKELKNVYLKSEVIGSSFFAFDYQYIYGLNSRAISFLRTLGYHFQEPSAEEFENAKQYVEENQIEPWPNEGAITLQGEDKIVIRLSAEY